MDLIIDLWFFFLILALGFSCIICTDYSVICRVLHAIPSNEAIDTVEVGLPAEVLLFHLIANELCICLNFLSKPGLSLLKRRKLFWYHQSYNRIDVFITKNIKYNIVPIYFIFVFHYELDHMMHSNFINNLMLRKRSLICMTYTTSDKIVSLVLCFPLNPCHNSFFLS